MLQRILFIAFCLTWFNVNSQDLDWVKGISADSFAKVYEIEFTPENDVIVSASTGGKAYLPDSGEVYNYYHFYNQYLIKYSEKGNLQWTFRPKSDSVALVGDFKIDRSGNIYILGYFAKNISIENDSFFTDTSVSFIAKLNSNKKLMWLRKSYGLGFDEIEIAPAGKIILKGYTKAKTVDIENGKSISHFETEYLRNFNYTAFTLEGDLLWSKFYGGDSIEFIESSKNWKATDNAIYELSDWGGDLDVETGPGKTVIQARKYFIDENYYLTKYDYNGDFLWVKILQKDTSSYSGRVHRIHFDVDENENLILAGGFYGKVDLDFSKKEYSIGKSEINDWFMLNYFVAKYDSSMALKWGYGSKNASQKIFLYFDRLKIKVKDQRFYLYGVNWNNLDLDFVGDNQLPNQDKNHFFAEYNLDGSLITARFIGYNYETDRHSEIFDLNIDEHKNVYLCGINFTNEKFDYDASLDSVFINDSTSKFYSGFIARYQTCKKPVQIMPQYENKDCNERMTTLYAQNDHFPVKWYDENGSLLHEGITYTLPQINYATKIWAEDGCNYRDEINITRQNRWPNIQKIYPNPASANITINLEGIAAGEINIQLINSLGQIIYTTSREINDGFQNINLPVSDVREGVYYMRIWNDCIKRTEKIVIVK